MHFDSYIMKNDAITLEADTIVEIRIMFSQWLDLMGMDPDVDNPALNTWAEVIE